MTTRELISQLQKADPEGNCHVVVHGDSGGPVGVSLYPHYYDGRELLVEYRDGKRRLISIEAGDKVVIHTGDLICFYMDRDGREAEITPIGSDTVSERTLETARNAIAQAMEAMFEP